jgi:hypothetical protein
VRDAALLEMQDAPPPPSESRTGESGVFGIGADLKTRYKMGGNYRMFALS